MGRVTPTLTLTLTLTLTPTPTLTLTLTQEHRVMIITTNDYKNESQAPLSARVASEPRPQP